MQLKYANSMTNVPQLIGKGKHNEYLKNLSNVISMN
jgi:hypothetical protein